MRPRTLWIAFGALWLPAVPLGCPASSDSGPAPVAPISAGGGGAGGLGPDAGASSASGGTGAAAAMGGGFHCEDLPAAVEPHIPYPPCDAIDEGFCLCEGCGHGAGCEDPGGAWYNDCVCPQCVDDPECDEPTFWHDNGRCDPYYEGCSSPDCADHPLCGTR